MSVGYEKALPPGRHGLDSSVRPTATCEPDKAEPEAAKMPTPFGSGRIANIQLLDAYRLTPGQPHCASATYTGTDPATVADFLAVIITV